MASKENSDFQKAIQRLDDDAWSDVIEAFDGPLRGYVRSVIKDLGIERDVGSADLAQTVYRRMLSALASGTVTFDSKEEARRWMFAVAINRARDLARGRRFSSLPEPEIAGSSPEPSDAAVTQEEQEELERLLAALSEEHRECAVLKYIDGLSWPEVAQRIKGNPQSAHALRVAFGRAVRAALSSLGKRTDE